MAAFSYAWMVIRHPDEFNVAEHFDEDFEQLYRHSLTLSIAGPGWCCSGVFSMLTLKD